MADIGIRMSCLKQIVPHIAENDPSLWLSKIPRFSHDKHKYNFGHTLVWGGKMTGAARLSSLAALRIGSGLVSVACPEGDHPVYALTSPSLIVHPMDTKEEFKALLSDKRINSILIGPGAGREVKLKSFIQDLLKVRTHSIVLDADAISVFESNPDDLLSLTDESTVLTPHEGEFKRLFPNLNGSKIENATAAARLSQGVIVMKGADTVIAAPDGRVVVNTNAPGWLARGGTGDVLAGIIAGLLAQGLCAFDAACAGVWVHGMAARHAGPGMIADDLLGGIKLVVERILHKEAD